MPGQSDQLDSFAPQTRLDISEKAEPLNRVFGECLAKYIDILGRKGCNRTAIEFCKLLLSLDPVNDPFGVLLRFDYYAIRAKEYGLLIQFVKNVTSEIYPEDKMASLLTMPNFLLTVPLAKYFERGAECLTSM